jgi:hypothetical protein
MRKAKGKMQKAAGKGARATQVRVDGRIAPFADSPVY